MTTYGAGKILTIGELSKSRVGFSVALLTIIRPHQMVRFWASATKSGPFASSVSAVTVYRSN